MTSKILTEDIKARLLVLREEGYSRRGACAVVDVLESTLRYQEQIGSFPMWRRGTAITDSAIKTNTSPYHYDNVPNQEIIRTAVGVTGAGNKDVPSAESRDTPVRKKRVAVIADTQCKPEESLEYMKWIGYYLASKELDLIVHIGDHYDFPSLSSYDKGKKSFEGRRLKADIEAGNLGLKYLNEELSKAKYKVGRRVFCKGNHEDRLDRLANDVPELEGFVGTENLPIEEMGWEVHPFLKPVEIDGITYVHFLANPFTGKPYGGTVLNQLKNVGCSFVVGHKQCLDMGIRPILNGKHQIGIISGACYPFNEGYKGYQGNNHFRGLVILNEVSDGFGLPMPVSLDYMKKFYEESHDTSNSRT